MWKEPPTTPEPIPIDPPEQKMQTPDANLRRTITMAAQEVKYKINPPDIFDGSYSKYRKWKCDLAIFLARNRITDDAQKIITMLSFM
jgi:hypothetical protein